MCLAKPEVREKYLEGLKTKLIPKDLIQRANEIMLIWQSVFRYGMDFLKRNFKNHQRKITCVFYGFKGVHKILGIFVT